MATSPPIRCLPDTNILIHYIRGDALAQRVEAQYGLRSAVTAPILSIVTVGEIRSLARQFGWGSPKMHNLENLLHDFVFVSLDFTGLVDAYAEIDDYNRRVGKPCGENDTWIAATARVTGALLITTDKDFDHLDPMFLNRDWIDPKIR